MQIRIDTDKDSPEHIREIIKFLQKIIGEDTSSGSGFVDMFSDSSSSGQSPSQVSDESNDMFSIFSDENPSSTIEAANKDESSSSEESVDEPKVQVIPY